MDQQNIQKNDHSPDNESENIEEIQVGQAVRKPPSFFAYSNTQDQIAQQKSDPSGNNSGPASMPAKPFGTIQKKSTQQSDKEENTLDTQLEIANGDDESNPSSGSSSLPMTIKPPVFQLKTEANESESNQPVQLRPNSYAEGKGLTWSNGTALLDDEYTEFFSTQGKGIGAFATLLAKSVGFDVTSSSVVEKLNKDAEDIIENNLEKELEQKEGILEFYEDQGTTGNPDVDQFREQDKIKLKAEIAEIERKLDEDIEKMAKNAISVAKKISEFGKSGSEMGASYGQVVNGATPELFENMGKFSDIFGKVLSGMELAIEAYNTSALENFKANPGFDTAKAWGMKVGNIFDKIGDVIPDDLPMGWGTVLKGACKMPKAVISQFAKLVEERYKKLDAEVHVPQGKLLKPGESG